MVKGGMKKKGTKAEEAHREMQNADFGMRNGFLAKTQRYTKGKMAVDRLLLYY
jgi:hypothetical protein